MPVIELNNSNFEEEVKQFDKTVLVDFWAPWCGPCKTMAPVVDELANDYDKIYKFCKVNIDDNPELSNKYGVMSIPTFMAFKDGEVSGKIIGVTDSTSILNILK